MLSQSAIRQDIIIGSSEIAKGHERRRTTCRRAWMASSRDTSDERALLATSRVPHQVQTVRSLFNWTASSYYDSLLNSIKMGLQPGDMIFPDCKCSLYNATMNPNNSYNCNIMTSFNDL